jgi:Zn-dependent protease
MSGGEMMSETEDNNYQDERGFRTLPVYPTPEYYQKLAQQQAKPEASSGLWQQQAGQQAPRTPAPAYIPPRQAKIRPHNAFSRFLINWGGGQRILLSIGSAIVSIVVYALYFGSGSFVNPWAFGLGFVGLICVHEFGHIIALRSKKLPATFPIFIPLIGAYVTLPNRPISSRDTAEIALAGPFLGGISSLFCLIMFWLNHGEIWGMLAFYGFLINMLNLVPVRPLDGGIVASTLSRWIAPFALALMGLYLIQNGNQFLWLLFIFGIFDVFQTFNLPSRAQTMHAMDKAIVAVMYIGLAMALGVGFWVINTL